MKFVQLFENHFGTAIMFVQLLTTLNRYTMKTKKLFKGQNVARWALAIASISLLSDAYQYSQQHKLVQHEIEEKAPQFRLLRPVDNPNGDQIRLHNTGGKHNSLFGNITTFLKVRAGTTPEARHKEFLVSNFFSFPRSVADHRAEVALTADAIRNHDAWQEEVDRFHDMLNERGIEGNLSVQQLLTINYTDKLGEGFEKTLNIPHPSFKGTAHPSYQKKIDNLYSANNKISRLPRETDLVEYAFKWIEGQYADVGLLRFENGH